MRFCTYYDYSEVFDGLYYGGIINVEKIDGISVEDDSKFYNLYARLSSGSQVLLASVELESVNRIDWMLFLQSFMELLEDKSMEEIIDSNELFEKLISQICKKKGG